jgi:methionyl aminopeptidase
MEKFELKTKEELEIMLEGGKKLARVKHALFDMVKAGVSAYDIEEAAMRLIKEEGAEPSFTKVPKYHWATCVNVNDGIVHGIPKKETVFEKGDLVSVDVGLFYKGFHTDTSFSVGVDVDPQKSHFLEVGRRALNRGIEKAKVGNKIYDISEAIEKVLREEGLTPVNGLVGHGVGRSLHENPQIPTFTYGVREQSPEIVVGAALAIEVMYTEGNGEIKLDKDGWTILTEDGTISGLFEETVLVTDKGSIVATK